MKRSAKLHALAATARIANIPSVAGNVWLGIALAAVTAGGRLTDAPFWPAQAVALGVAAVCLYLAGNFLNDWADRDWDAAHRPERALPQALFPAGFYLLVAALCALAGVGVAAAVGFRCLVVALMIGCCIGFYTRIHKHSAWSVIPMGLCRALLPVLGFVAFARPVDSLVTTRGAAPAAVAACAFGLFCHIAGLSMSARYESMAQPPAVAMRFARALFPAAAASMFLASWLALSFPLRSCVPGLLPYVLWIALCFTVFRQPVTRLIAGLLAGIPLVDWIVLLALSLTPGAGGGWLAIPAISLVLPPLAFLAGRLLQRLAPAT